MAPFGILQLKRIVKIVGCSRTLTATEQPKVTANKQTQHVAVAVHNWRVRSVKLMLGTRFMKPSEKWSLNVDTTSPQKTQINSGEYVSLQYKTAFVTLWPWWTTRRQKLDCHQLCLVHQMLLMEKNKIIRDVKIFMVSTYRKNIMNRANGPCDMDISKTCNKFHMVFSVFIWMSPVKCNLTCASPFNRWTISRSITSNQLRQYWACLFCYQHHSALVDIFMASQNNQPFCLEQWNVWPTWWHSLHMPALSER